MKHIPQPYGVTVFSEKTSQKKIHWFGLIFLILWIIYWQVLVTTGCWLLVSYLFSAMHSCKSDKFHIFSQFIILFYFPYILNYLKDLLKPDGSWKGYLDLKKFKLLIMFYKNITFYVWYKKSIFYFNSMICL